MIYCMAGITLTSVTSKLHSLSLDIILTMLMLIPCFNFPLVLLHSTIMDRDVFVY